jgi:selenide,water dikinase
VLKNFAMNPIAGVRLTLVNRDLYTPNSVMLPGFIAGHYTYDDAHVDLFPPPHA